MMHGNPGDAVIIVENGAGCEYAHISECSQVAQADVSRDYRYECANNYVDAHCYKTIFVKRDLSEIKP